MGVGSVPVGPVELAVALCSIGAIFIASAIAIDRRSGRRGIITLWMVATVVIAVGIAQALSMVFRDPGLGWSFYFRIPLLFFSVQLGLVAFCVHDTTRRGVGLALRFAFAILAFFAAIIPATAVAVLPDVIWFLPDPRA